MVVGIGLLLLLRNGGCDLGKDRYAQHHPQGIGLHSYIHRLLLTSVGYPVVAASFCWILFFYQIGICRHNEIS